MTLTGYRVVMTSVQTIGTTARMRRAEMSKQPKAPQDARSDQQNPNKGTPGTNPLRDKAQGNRGKQLNPNQGQSKGR